MKAIIDRVIVPEFRNDNYAAGIALGVDAVISVLTDDKTAAPADPLHVKIWNRIKRLFLAVGNWIYLSGSAVASVAGPGLSPLEAGPGADLPE